MQRLRAVDGSLSSFLPDFSTLCINNKCCVFASLRVWVAFDNLSEREKEKSLRKKKHISFQHSFDTLFQSKLN